MEVPIRNESNVFLKSEIILLHYVVVRLVLFDFFLAHTCLRTESSNCSSLDVDDSMHYFYPNCIDGRLGVTFLWKYFGQLSGSHCVN